MTTLTLICLAGYAIGVLAFACGYYDIAVMRKEITDGTWKIGLPIVAILWPCFTFWNLSAKFFSWLGER